MPLFTHNPKIATNVSFELSTNSDQIEVQIKDKQEWRTSIVQEYAIFAGVTHLFGAPTPPLALGSGFLLARRVIASPVLYFLMAAAIMTNLSLNEREISSNSFVLRNSLGMLWRPNEPMAYIIWHLPKYQLACLFI